MLVVSAASTAAGIIADDRSLAQQTADLELKTGIEKSLLSNASTLAAQVNVDVYLGRVMLTGVVPDWSARRTVVDLARQAAGDHEIYDDVEVAAGSLSDSATDFAVNKELGVNLLAAETLASQSLLHRVVNGAAFVMGEANDESQVETVRHR